MQRANAKIRTKQAVMSWAMLTGIAFFACACTEQEANRSSQDGRALYYETLTLRYQPNPENIDLAKLAEDLGYLAPIQLKNIGASSSETHIIESVLAKHSDFGSVFNGTIALSRANGNPVRALIGALISGEQNGYSCFVMDGSPIHNAYDLIGKQLAINSSDAHSILIVKDYLYRNGLSKKEAYIELIETPVDKVEPLLRSGKIDAALSRNGIRNRDGLRILFSDVDANGPYFLYTQKLVNFMKVWGVASEDVGSRDRCRQAPMDGFTAVLDRHIPYLLFLDGFSIKREYIAGSYFFTENFIETHPNTVDKFVDAIAQTIEWLRHSPREVVAERLTNLNSMARANQAVDHEIINDFSRGGLLRDHDFQRWVDLFMIDEELHTNEIEVKSIYDNRYNPYWYGNPNLKRKAQSIL